MLALLPVPMIRRSEHNTFKSGRLTNLRDLLSRAFYRRQVVTSRLLLKHGVDINHISGRGSTPLFHLYNPGRTENLSPELLEMLISHGFANVNVQSVEGWSGLHRAAAYGSAEDVRHLLYYKADTTLRTCKLLWTPIFCSVRFGNQDTLRELAGVEGSFIKRLVDIRGWSLLHIAVDYGSFQVIPFLLKAGLDPHAYSCASDRSLPPELQGRRLTSIDIAEYHGPERVEKYHDVLRLAGLETVLDEEGDIFWPAE